MWHRRIIIALYALLLISVPLLMSTTSSEMFEFPKMMAIYSLTLLIVSIYLLGFMHGKWSFYPTTLTLCLLFWLSTQIIATVFSIDWYTSFFGYYGRFNGGLLSTITYASLIIVGQHTLDEHAKKFLWRVSLTTAVIVLLWGLPGRVGSFDMSCLLFRGEWSASCWTNEFRPYERMFSTLGQPNWLGLYFAVHALVAWSRGHIHAGIRSKRTGYALLSVVFLFGVWATGSRSAELGVFMVLPILACPYISKIVRPRVLLILILLVSLGGIIAASVYTQKLRVVQPGITHSGTIRLIVWEGAWKLFEKYPIVGTGPETFAFTYPLTRPADHNLTTEKDFIYNKAHNELLHILATSGALGLIGYLILNGYVLMQAWCQRKFLVAAGLICMHTINFFGFSTSTSQLLWIFLILDVSHPSILAHPRRSLRNLRSQVERIVGTVCILASVAYGFWYLSLYIGADYAYGRGISRYQSGDAAQATIYFSDAYALRTEHLYANRLALAAAQSAYVLSKEPPEQSVLEDTDYLSQVAISYQNLAMRSSLSNPYYWRDRAKMYVFLSEVSTEEAKLASYKKSVTTSISRAKKLAPTDTTLDDIEGLLK